MAKLSIQERLQKNCFTIILATTNKLEFRSKMIFEILKIENIRKFSSHILPGNVLTFHLTK